MKSQSCILLGFGGVVCLFLFFVWLGFSVLFCFLFCFLFFVLFFQTGSGGRDYLSVSSCLPVYRLKFEEIMPRSVFHLKKKVNPKKSYFITLF